MGEKQSLAEMMGFSQDRENVVREAGRKILNEHTRQEDILDAINLLPLSSEEKVLLAFTIGIAWAHAYGGRSGGIIVIGPFPGG